MAGGQPAEDGTKTKVGGQVGPEVAHAEPATAVDGERDPGEMRISTPVRVDAGRFGQPNEGFGALRFTRRRAAEAYLSGRGAADRNAVPVEDEHLTWAKLALRRPRQLDSLSRRHVARGCTQSHEYAHSGDLNQGEVGNR